MKKKLLPKYINLTIPDERVAEMIAGTTLGDSRPYVKRGKYKKRRAEKTDI